MFYKLTWLIRTFFLRIKLKRIGLFSYVGSPIFIYNGRGITIGTRVRVFPGSRMEVHNNGKIVLEDNISIGQNFHLISSDEKLIIRKNTTISGNVFITNVDHDYQQIGVHILDQKYKVNTTEINENCFIGYGAVLQAGTILGKQCIVGANSVVRGIFPDYSVIVGAPGRIIKRYNVLSAAWEKTDPAGNFIK